MSEYRISSADIAIRCDATIDDLIDVLEAKGRAYIPVRNLPLIRYLKGYDCIGKADTSQISHISHIC
jgi:ribosome-interacting GTPase 1